jgi:YidC/Oxa1 family membrane protein insertase
MAMDNQRPILYLSLAFILFLIWQAWEQDYGTAARVDQPVIGEPGSASDPARLGAGAPDVPQGARPEVSDAPLAVADPVAAAATPTGLRVRSDVLDLVIDLRGGDISRADLPTYPVSLDEPDNPVRILDRETRRYVAQSGLIHDPGEGIDPAARAPSHHASFTASASEYTLGDGQETLEVPLVWEGPTGVRVEKTYRLTRGSFLVELEHRVINGGADPWVGRQYRQLRHGPAGDDDGSTFLYTYTGSAYFDGAYEKLPFDDMSTNPLALDVTGGWVSMLQHYFISAWIPGAEETNRFYSKVIGSGVVPEYIIGMSSPSQIAQPGESVAFTSGFYVGPKLQEQLDEIAEGLALTVDYGMLTFLAKPMFWVMEWAHGWIGNWGWSIVFVTVLLKLIFYKLSETSYRSMARMRTVAPKLQAMKERFGDDKQRLNQALMDLYKKEKINPLGGCLPILVQIPFFIAFYWMLVETVELRQAPWILWIDDLSTKDPFFVLPILMGVSMVIQQRLNPQPLDPIQQKVMMILPIVFTVFFAFFPSGLVIYWLFNNILSIAQQWVITRRIEQQAKKA